MYKCFPSLVKIMLMQVHEVKEGSRVSYAYEAVDFEQVENVVIIKELTT